MKQILYLIIPIAIIGCSSYEKVTIEEKLARPEQEFQIDNTKDTILEGNEGTLIFIEKGSFQDHTYNTVLDSISVTLTEL